MSVEITALNTIPDISAGDDLAQIIVKALDCENIALSDKHILVVAHKIVSKAEGRVVDLTGVEPTPKAEDMARKTRKDPRKVQVILNESANILRVREPLQQDGGEGLIIARHKNGYVCANAGVDESNVGREGAVVLLPLDADKSAQRLRQDIHTLTGIMTGIIVSDTFGRAWRYGQVNVAIGLAGVPAITDLMYTSDAWGRTLTVTKPAFADELAAASGLVMEKKAKTPVVVFSGLQWQAANGTTKDLIRLPEEDLFL